MQDKPLSELLQPFERYPTSGEINLKVNDRNKTLAELSEQYKDGHVDHLDGLSVDYPDWWFNVRSSHTESVLRVNIGASSQELLKDKQQTLLGEIASINEGLSHKITAKADVTNAKAG
jgi:phosphomannomutase